MRQMKVLNDIGQVLHDYCFREDILEEPSYLDMIAKKIPQVDIGEISDHLLLMRFFIVDFGVKLALGQNNGEDIAPILDSFRENLHQTLNSQDFPRVQSAMNSYWSCYQSVGADRFIDEVPYVFERICGIQSEDIRFVGLNNFSLFFDFVIKTSQLESIYQ
ncbi:hypothetical protein [Neobacillus niacini]|uniref:hypothetical protein n=1 Tax=Neobacillus niacini TaxID=86668 RepID=UPI003982F936